MPRRHDFTRFGHIMTDVIPLGVGIYTRAEASRLLRMTPSRLSRWVRGYTYWLRGGGDDQRRRDLPPVATTDLPVVDGAFALSFVELLELRVVKAFVDEKDISLQRVRIAALRASEQFDTPHPFASRRVYTDGQQIFAALSQNGEPPDVVQLTGSSILQISSGGIVGPFIEEIEFDEQTALAHKYWPLGKRTPVVLDPRIAFGAPIVAGTATRTDAVAALARAAGNENAAANGYDLPKKKVRAAVRFEELLLAA